MIKIENVEVLGWEYATRGMRKGQFEKREITNDPNA